MKTAIVTLASLFSFVLFACHHDAPTAAPEHKEAKDDHENLSAPVKAFHDEMAPLWHADKSPERTAKTCEHAPALQQKAGAVGDKDLIAATSDLGAECAKTGRPDFEAKFAEVHDKFHKAASSAEKH